MVYRKIRHISLFSLCVCHIRYVKYVIRFLLWISKILFSSFQILFSIYFSSVICMQKMYYWIERTQTHAYLKGYSKITTIDASIKHTCKELKWHIDSHVLHNTFEATLKCQFCVWSICSVVVWWMPSVFYQINKPNLKSLEMRHSSAAVNANYSFTCLFFPV